MAGGGDTVLDFDPSGAAFAARFVKVYGDKVSPLQLAAVMGALSMSPEALCEPDSDFASTLASAVDATASSTKKGDQPMKPHARAVMRWVLRLRDALKFDGKYDPRYRDFSVKMLYVLASLRLPVDLLECGLLIKCDGEGAGNGDLPQRRQVVQELIAVYVQFGFTEVCEVLRWADGELAEVQLLAGRDGPNSLLLLDCVQDTWGKALASFRNLLLSGPEEPRVLVKFVDSEHVAKYDAEKADVFVESSRARRRNEYHEKSMTGGGGGGGGGASSPKGTPKAIVLSSHADFGAAPEFGKGKKVFMIKNHIVFASSGSDGVPSYLDMRLGHGAVPHPLVLAGGRGLVLGAGELGGYKADAVGLSFDTLKLCLSDLLKSPTNVAKVEKHLKASGGMQPTESLLSYLKRRFRAAGGKI